MFPGILRSQARMGRRNVLIPTTVALADIFGWWDFQEGSGTSLADATGNNSPATGYNIGWGTGGPANLPNGVDFNGSNAYVDFNFNPTIADGTILAWFELDTPSGGQTLVGAGNYGGDFDLSISTVSTEGRLRGASRIGGNDRIITEPIAITASVLTLGAYGWKTSGTDDQLELWRNETSVASLGPANLGSVNFIPDNMIGGRRTSSGSAWLNGRMFQVALFTRKLTTTEIAELYNGGAGGRFDQFAFA